MLAMAVDDRVAAIAMADLVIAAEPHGALDLHVAAARAYRQLASGESAAAVAAFAAIQRDFVIDEASPWWHKLTAADFAAGAAMAFLATDDRAMARRTLAIAAKLYDDIRAAAPPPVLHRRQSMVATLEARASR